MQVDKRIKGRRDNIRLINGENGFTGAQYANTARGTKHKNKAQFGATGTFTARENIAQDEEILIDYDGNCTGVNIGTYGVKRPWEMMRISACDW